MTEVIGIDHIYIAVSDLGRSEAFYDKRLEAAPGNERQGIVLVAERHAALKPSGLSFVEVEHTGCGQRSEEEAAVVNWLVDSLLHQEWTNRDGGTRKPNPPSFRLTLDFSCRVDTCRRVRD